jgi:GNAT superfamily N-acetyltransferase
MSPGDCPGGAHSVSDCVQPVIRRMEPSEQHEVIAVTARAFWHDPLFDFFARDLLHEHVLLPRIFRLFFRDLRAPGAEVWVGEHLGRPRGLAGWLPPGSFPRPAREDAERAIRSIAALARTKNRLKAGRLLFEVDKRHIHEPHWYLALLATDPSAQGHGIGSALLTPVLERCDGEGIVAYLETQKEANVAWYGRAGFEVCDEIRLPDTPPVWCLRREPRAP